jgi:hypothetical protein
MADQKLTALTAFTDPDPADLMYAVDGAVSKKITIDSLLRVPLPVTTGGGDTVGWRTVYNTTTDATQTELFTDGSSARLTIPSDSLWFFSARIAARRTDADNEGASYELRGTIDNNAGTTALVGQIMKIIYGEDTSAWDVTASADDTNDALLIQVTGEAAKTIDWICAVLLVQASG